MTANETTRKLARRPWVPPASESITDDIAEGLPPGTTDLISRIEDLVDQNAQIHDVECVNLNPATNTMSPRALAALSSGISTRTSLGYAGAKYEMGLEAIERIEVIAAELAARLFNASHVEIRVPSGAMANLYAFMAVCAPEDPIVVPPASIGGHVTHHQPGAAGLYGLSIHEAPVDAERYTFDVDALAELAARVKPKLITVGGSLNLMHHDVPTIRSIADSVGACVLFDAAHLSGPIAGGAWPNPLDEGAHIMTMSTYKSLAGPTAGLVLTNETALAQRVDEIAFPGLTANFDASKSAALAITLADWLEHGRHHAEQMLANAMALSDALSERGLPLFVSDGLATRSHAFALDARSRGGGTTLANHLRRANLLTSSIGLPSGLDDGLRVGTNELTRLGATADDMAELAELIARAIESESPAEVAMASTSFRSRFREVCFAG